METDDDNPCVFLYLIFCGGVTITCANVLDHSQEFPETEYYFKGLCFSILLSLS